jgi:hypothetical protein
VFDYPLSYSRGSFMLYAFPKLYKVEIRATLR